ncbi:uncharacterized protein LOC141901785 isoform X2 [Tubulanus polymorphus]|uniref:uncharacterized protein LOC141901785 isoform X2 n=1 Tax=Tubulanus polymorphus TaxID=672921 RepID=UPI003DA5549B
MVEQGWPHREKSLRVFLLVVLVGAIEACDIPPGETKYVPPTFQEVIVDSEVIVIGRALRNIPDRSLDFEDLRVNAFTSEIKVSCIFKGDMPITPVMNISENGAIPGMCIETKVEVGKEYIFAMSEHDGTFRLWHDTIDKNEANIEKLTKQCGLFSMPPVGSPDSETSVCPPVADPDSCELYTPPPPPVDVAPTKKTINENDEGPMSEEVPIDGKESSAKLKPEPVSGGDRSLSGVAASLRYTAFSIFSTVCLAILAQ